MTNPRRETQRWASRGTWRATSVGLAIIVLSGVGYRLTALRFERDNGEAALPRGTLAALTHEIGPWRGRDAPLDEDVVRATNTDDLLNRTYTRVGGLDTVGLYVAYGGRLRDLAPHRPQVCYPGAGWTSEGVQDVDLEMADGRRLPCQIHHFGRGGLAKRRVVVLSCYLIDGRFGRDISMVRSMAWQFNSDKAHMAQMQVVCDVAQSYARSESFVSDFAVLAAPLLDQVLARAIADQEPEQERDRREQARGRSPSLAQSGRGVADDDRLRGSTP